MKRASNINVFLATLTIFLSVTFAQAQPRGKQGPHPIPDAKSVAAMVDNLSDELALNDLQKEKLSDIYTNHFDLLREMVEEDKNSRPDREMMDNMKNDFETEVKSVLTEDQQKKFDTYMKRTESLRGGRGKSRK
ncbi:MAG: hypothetical protein V2I62_10080 [Bacteroidales bacterium]|jgi:hypothetical protein|nr:hypothetical protein [Bacteroidales bacterium]